MGRLIENATYKNNLFLEKDQQAKSSNGPEPKAVEKNGRKINKLVDTDQNNRFIDQLREEHNSNKEVKRIQARTFSIDSTDSGYDEEMIFSTLSQLLEGSGLDRINDALDGLNRFERAEANFSEIEAYLTSADVTNQEKQSFLLETTDLLAHLTREEDPTSPELVVGGLQFMFDTCRERLSEFQQNPQMLVELFGDSDPCFEARFERFCGSDSARVISGLDENQTAQDNLSRLLQEMSNEHDEEIDAAAFKSWVMERDGIVGANVADGKIDEAAIDEFIAYGRDIMIFD